MIACGDAWREESIGKSEQALTSAGQRVLGYENPQADWVLGPGSSGAISSTTTRTQGSAALQLSNFSWAQLQSVRIGSVGSFSPSTASFDLRVSGTGNLPWGDAIFQYDAPSKGILNAQAGQRVLGGTARGVWQNVSIPLSADFVNKISTASDLSIRISINLPAGSTAVFDNYKFGTTGGGGTGGSGGVGGSSGSGGSGGGGTGGSGGSGGSSGSGGRGGSGGSQGGSSGTSGSSGSGGSGGAAGSTSVVYFVNLPAGVARESVAIGQYGATGALTLEDFVDVFATGTGYSSISSVLSPNQLTLGKSGDILHAWSQSSILMKTSSRARGNVTTEGTLVRQTGAIVDGTTAEHASLEPIQDLSWTVVFSNASLPPTTVGGFQTVTLGPGDHGATVVHSNGRLRLLTGEHRFTSLDVRSGGVLEADNVTGGVLAYVRGAFAWNGSASFTNSSKTNLLVGLASSAPVTLATQFKGVLVAPYASVTLGPCSPHHIGSFFAASLVVRADVKHKPFRPEDFCPPAVGPSGLCPSGPGGSCTTDGDCTLGNECVGGTCTCAPQCTGKPCGAADSCGSTCRCGPGGSCTVDTDCREDLRCVSGTCTTCAPQCDGKPCGASDACGGTCRCGPGGSCTVDPDCQDGLTCVGGTCTCAPQCEGKACGADDGCGNPCRCGPGATGCTENAHCADELICFRNTCMPEICLFNPIIGGCGFAGAACGSSCTRQPECQSNADCPTGYICPAEPNGQYYAVPGKRICELPDCKLASTLTGCGGPWDECGACRCTAQCEGKSCGDADLSDGCGGRCSKLCGDGEAGCQVDADCQTGSVCRDNTCRPSDPCANPDLQPPDCGPNSLCGECPVLPLGACVDRECGNDPTTGQSCGPLCPAGFFCNAAGHCGELDVTPNIRVRPEGLPEREIVPPASPAAIGIGAISGAFSVSDRGAATYAIPIDVPPGRAGIEPTLALGYSSSTGNGALGVGWSVDGLSTISRCQRMYALDGYTQAVLGNTLDALCLDGQRLVVVNGKDYWEVGAEYRTRVESFDKVVLENRGPGGTLSFTVYKKDGRIFRYGESTTARSFLIEPAIGTWALSRVEDRSSNFMSISYRSERRVVPARPNIAQATWEVLPTTAELLPATIAYTGRSGVEGDREIIFNYLDVRSDRLFGRSTGGGTVWRKQRLDRIDVRAGNKPVRSYSLGYIASPSSDPRARSSLLQTITECTPSACKPATTFDYYGGELGFEPSREVAVTHGNIEFDPPYGPEDICGNPNFYLEGLVRYGIPYNVGGHDRLRTMTVNTYVTDLTPYFGLAAFAVSFTPYVGPIAAMMTNVAGEMLSGSSSEYKAYNLDFQGHFRTGASKPCGKNLPTWHIYAQNPIGNEAEELHATCGSRKMTGQFVFDPDAINQRVEREAFWTRPMWLVDTDGDGVQDKLTCSVDNNHIVTTLASRQPNRSEVPIDATNWDGIVEPWGDMCAVKCPPVPIECEPGICNNCATDPENCRPECARLPRSVDPCSGYLNCVADQPFSTTLDVDGDGTAELVVHDRNKGWAALTFHGTSASWRTDWFVGVDLDAFSDFVTTIDANGDGLRDIIGLPSGALLHNTGNGFLQTYVAGDASMPRYPPFVVDVDADGAEELVYPGTSGTWQQRRIGALSFSTEDFALEAGPGALGDFDGDGNLDAFTNRGSGAADCPFITPFLFHRGKDQRHKNLLKTVTDGLGHRVEVNYGPGDLPEEELSMSMQNLDDQLDNSATRGAFCRWPVRCTDVNDAGNALVSSYEESHLVDATIPYALDRTFQFARFGAQTDMAGYGFLGFLGRQVKVRDSFGKILSDTTIIARNARLDLMNLPVPEPGPYAYVGAGMPEKVSVQRALHEEDPQGGGPTFVIGPLTETTIQYQIQTSTKGLPFANPVYRLTQTYGPTSTGNGRVMNETEMGQLMDEYGNVTYQNIRSRDSDGSNPIPGSETKNEVIRDMDLKQEHIDAWLISLPMQDQALSTPRCPTPDQCNTQTQTRRTTYEYYSTGLLEWVHRMQGGVEFERNTHLIRDGFGNIKTSVTTDLQNNVREAAIDYDSRDLFPIAIRQIGEGRELKSQVRYDNRFGELVVRVDPNGIDETFSLDDFGIMRRYHGSGGDAVVSYGPGVRYSLPPGFPVEAAYQFTSTVDGGETNTVEFNSFGQPVRRISTGFNGELVSSERQYDWRRRLVTTTRPHLGDDITPQGVFNVQYDDLDRPIYEARADGAVVFHDYAFISDLATGPLAEYRFFAPPGTTIIEKVTDPRDHATVTFSNRLGQPAAIVDPNRISTYYQYGAFDLLREITRATFEDPEPIIEIEHDQLGRVRTVTDQARGGTETYAYNGFDEVVIAFDPVGRTRTLTYDDFGRLEHIDDRDGATHYIYDGSGPNELGRLVETVSPTEQRVRYGFESPQADRNRGLPTRVTQILTPLGSTGGETRELTTSYTFDQFSRPSVITYPQTGTRSLEVQNVYDDFGHLKAVTPPESPTEPYWELVSADEGYRIGTERIGSASCNGERGTTTTRTYYQDTGNLESISSTCGDAVLQNLRYVYDQKDNLFIRMDLREGVGENFLYDELDRPTHVNDVETFEYDNFTGRIESQVGVGTYGYRSDGRDWIDSAGDISYDHDVVGNITLRQGRNVLGGTQTFEYTAFDLPKSVTSGQSGDTTTTEFAYDASGVRVVKQSPDRRQYYAGNLYHRVEQAQTTHTAFIYAGGRAIAAATAFEDGPSVSDFTLHYLYDDALGSIQAVATQHAAVEATRDYAPFGKLRSGQQGVVPFGFTGHEEDTDLGLINMGGRMYDPEMGQFMSADPMMTYPASQGLNRFAYVDNSPLNYVDPTGFARASSGATGYSWTTGDSGADAAIGVGVFFGGVTAYGFFSSSAGAATINAIGSAASDALSAAGSAMVGVGDAFGGLLASPVSPANVASALENLPEALHALSGPSVNSTQSQGIEMSRAPAARGGGPPAPGRVSSNGWAPGDPLDPDQITKANPTLTERGFGFKDTPDKQSLPEEWQRLLQPLFDPYGVNLADIEVYIKEMDDSGQFLGGNKIALRRADVFGDNPSASGVVVADSIAHEVEHTYQAKIMKVSREQLAHLINVETGANAARGVPKYAYPEGFDLPRPDRLPGKAPLDGIANRFGQEAQKIYKQAIKP